MPEFLSQDPLREIIELARSDPDYAREMLPQMRVDHAAARLTWHHVLEELVVWPEDDIETGVMMLAWARDEVFTAEKALAQVTKYATRETR